MVIRRGPKGLARANNAGFMLSLSSLPEREATVLDIVRTRGEVTTAQVQAVLGHANKSGVQRLLTCLVEAGLVERHNHRTFPASYTYTITEHGRTVF